MQDIDSLNLSLAVRSRLALLQTQSNWDGHPLSDGCQEISIWVEGWMLLALNSWSTILYLLFGGGWHALNNSNFTIIFTMICDKTFGSKCIPTNDCLYFIATFLKIKLFKLKLFQWKSYLYQIFIYNHL